MGTTAHDRERDTYDVFVKAFASNWTVHDGRSNSSPEFKRLVREVERLIRADAHKLIAGRADMTAALIVAQLAHVHGLAPKGEA